MNLHDLDNSIRNNKQLAEGYTVVPGIDRERYTDRPGLEGPFHTKNGKVVYYDKKEGKYYDPSSDFYISHEDWQAMNEENVAEGAEIMYAEELAEKVFNQSPNLQNDDDILTRGFQLAKKDPRIGGRVNAIFRTEDFPSDFVSYYRYIQHNHGISSDMNEGNTDEGVLGFMTTPQKRNAKKPSISSAEMRKYFEKEKPNDPPNYNSNTGQRPHQVYTRSNEEQDVTEGTKQEMLFYAKLSDGSKVYARVKDAEQLGNLQQQYRGAEIKTFDFNRPDILDWLEARGINLRKFAPGMVQTMYPGSRGHPRSTGLNELAPGGSGDGYGYKSLSTKQIMKLINSGNWEAMSDIKPNGHLQLRNTRNGKHTTIHVKQDVAEDLPPPENARKTQIAGTLPTYKKAADMIAKTGVKGKALDFGAGLGHGTGELGKDAHSYEPFPGEKFKPHFIDVTKIPDNTYHKIVNLNVLNVVPNVGDHKIRDSIVKNIGRVLAPGGVAIITTRGKDVLTIKGTPGEEPMSMISKIGTYQKGFSQVELAQYVRSMLGDGFDVSSVKLGPAGVMIKKKSEMSESGDTGGLKSGSMISVTTIKGTKHQGTFERDNGETIVMRTIGRGGNPHTNNTTVDETHIVVLKKSHIKSIAAIDQGVAEGLNEFSPIKPPTTTSGAFGGNKDYGQPTSSRYIGSNKFVVGTTNNYVLTATIDKWGLEWDEDDEIWFLDSPGAAYIADATEGEIELPAPQEQKYQIHDLVTDYLNERNSADLQKVAAYYGHSDDGEMATNEGIEEGVAEGKVINTYLWHGSRQKIPMLEPRQAVDTGGAAGSNQNAIYATSDPIFAIQMGMPTAGSDYGNFPNDPQMVLFSGKIRKGEYVYLHKLPFNGPDGKPQFVQGGNSREFHSIPGVEGIKPIEVKEIPVNKYLNLIRKATPADLKLRKKYMKEQGVAEATDADATVEAHGYTYNNRDQRMMWTKTFSSEEAAYKWANARNATILDFKELKKTVDETIGAESDSKYKAVEPYKNYKIFVRIQAFNNKFDARTEIGKTELIGIGSNPDDAVTNVKLKIDQMLNAAVPATGGASIDFNVKFVTDILGTSRPFLAKIEKINGEPKLVIAGDYFSDDPDIAKLGFKRSHIRTTQSGEFATQLPMIALTTRAIQGTGLIANGRYEIGNENRDDYDNRIFDLTYNSTAHTASDKVRLKVPALTVGTAR